MSMYKTFFKAGDLLRNLSSLLSVAAEARRDAALAASVALMSGRIIKLPMQGGSDVFISLLVAEAFSQQHPLSLGQGKLLVEHFPFA